MMTATTSILTRNDLRTKAPSVFAASPWEKMSARYRMVPTIEVVDLLADQGFRPVMAAQNRTRIKGKGDFTKHLIRFRHETHLNLRTVGAEIPEVVLTNSHDGTSAYRFMCGIFRLVCSNGMVVHSADFGSIAVNHKGGEDFGDRIIDATYEVVSEMPRTLETIEEWKQIELTPPQQEAFAAAALELRDNKLIEPKQLLTPRRVEDRKDDVWTTSNRIQENLIRGGIRGRSGSGRRTTTRPVRSVNEDLRLNRALWTLTERLAAAVS
jgi:hypothetical protein